MKIVQVGVGQWGKNHYRLLKDTGMLKAVCDIDTEKLTVAMNDGIGAYDSLQTMIENIKPDIAIVTTPTSAHFHTAHKLLLEGVNVFIEKPFTQTVNDGNTLIQLAHKKGLKLTCGYIERFNPVTQYIANMSEIPKLIEFHRESMLPSHIKDVGIVLDTSVHDIETACYLFGGYPEKVTSVLKSFQDNDIEDMAIITMDFGVGVATITSNWNTHVKSRLVHATFGDFIVRGDFVEKTTQKLNIDGSSLKYRHVEVNPLKDELLSFIACVRDNSMPEVLPEHANRITSIANDIVEGFKNNGQK